MEPGRLWMLLTELSDRLEISVRVETLENGEGYSTRSGMCRMGGRMVAFVDGRLPIAARARRLGKVLCGLGLENVHMLPALREYLEELAAEPDDDDE